MTPTAPEVITAEMAALKYGHTNIDSNTTIKTVKNEDADDEEKDLRVCGFGADAFFEWITEYGDPIGDVFYELPNDA